MNNLGGFYTSPSLHFLGGTGYIASGIFVPSSATVNAQNLNLSPSAFQPLLSFSSHVLNYDTIYSPTPPPSHSSGGASGFVPKSVQENLIYKLCIADAEFFDHLPIYPHALPLPFLFKEKELISSGRSLD